MRRDCGFETYGASAIRIVSDSLRREGEKRILVTIETNRQKVQPLEPLLRLGGPYEPGHKARYAGSQG